ncbi:MAG: hypothetical protein D3908_07145 [Candidatus Electrothrix sp. AUS4]|nr:hypothetical protein [Candidatus Electrothrix sp. AUS4]
MGTIAFSQGNAESKIYTFDIFPWKSFNSHLSDEYFSEGKVQQIIGDLSDIIFFEQYVALLNKAKIIFIDAPKDGVFEYAFIENLTKLEKLKSKILIIDDIKFVNMLDLWHNIASPKIDVSSFGHWSGTGIVDISNGLEIA